MCFMTVTVPESLAKGRSNEWATLHLAIGLYVSREATLGQAASAAGLSQIEFQRELGKRKIAINYSMEDFQSDLKAVGELSGR
jgi:predicted HTH domain antitoxin